VPRAIYTAFTLADITGRTGFAVTVNPAQARPDSSNRGFTWVTSGSINKASSGELNAAIGIQAIRIQAPDLPNYCSRFSFSLFWGPLFILPKLARNPLA